MLQRVLDRAHRGDAVHQGAHAADALDVRPSVARIAPAHDDLEAPDHGPGRVGLLDHVAVHLRLDPQVTLDTGHGIDDIVISDAAATRQRFHFQATRLDFATEKLGNGDDLEWQ
jgi:hypothetical protein